MSEAKDDTTDEAFPGLQYARGAMKRCALCGSARRLAETVVADGRRICKSRTDCDKLKQHAEAQENAHALSESAARKLPKPTKAETVWAPRFLNSNEPEPA